MTNYEPATFPYGSFLSLIGICVGIYLFFKYFNKLCRHLSERSGGEIPPGKVAWKLYSTGVFLLAGFLILKMIFTGGLADWYEIRLMIYQVIVVLYCGFVFPIATKFILDVQRTNGAPAIAGFTVFAIITVCGNLGLAFFLGI